MKRKEKKRNINLRKIGINTVNSARNQQLCYSKSIASSRRYFRGDLFLLDFFSWFFAFFCLFLFCVWLPYGGMLDFLNHLTIDDMRIGEHLFHICAITNEIRCICVYVIDIFIVCMYLSLTVNGQV